jgi:hypothetical protein
MATFTGIMDAAKAVQDFMLDRSAALPDPLRERIRGRLLGSKVDLVCQTAEDIYANREGLPEEVLELGAGLAVYGESEAFHGLDADSRGGRMAAVMRGQEIAEVPEPQQQYLPAAEAPESPEAPETVAAAE